MRRTFAVLGQKDARPGMVAASSTERSLTTVRGTETALPPSLLTSLGCQVRDVGSVRYSDGDG
jgi:hypothetical protein